MPRPLRFVPPGALVEVTLRAIQGRLLLRPSVELNEIVLGVLGRALALYPVALHAFVFMSNHAQLLLSTPDPLLLSNFMRYLASNLAREAGRLHGWREKLWGRRYRSIVVLDEEAAVERLRYILAHGCKEGLVAQPEDWPGATSLPGLLRGKPLRGTWFDRTAEYRAHRRGERPEPRAYATEYEVPLTPLPCWAGLSSQERQARCVELVSGIEDEAASQPRKPLGREAILAQDPHGLPESVHRSPAPLCHASSKPRRQRFRQAYNAFLEAFRRAASLLRAGIGDVAFPEGSFPPAQAFTPFSNNLEPVPP